MTSKPNSESTEVLYEGPMSTMITTLKIFSLTSAVLSTVGLPALMLSRGMDMYTGIHVMMVTTTISGSIGSTLGLQYIFSPYVYRLEKIPAQQCEDDNGEKVEGNTDSESQKGEDSSASAAIPKSKSDYLLKATTRSLFAMKVEHVFDPETDITGVPAGTIRPFLSFYAKGRPLYIHEQMIQDPLLNQNLFIDKATLVQKHKNPDPDDDFLWEGQI